MEEAHGKNVLNLHAEECSKTVEFDGSERQFYSALGRFLNEIVCPNYVTVSSEGFGSAEYEVRARGTYDSDGKKVNSPYVVEKTNDVSGLTVSPLQECYMTCLNAGSNMYKYYHMKPDTPLSEVFTAIWGRQGETPKGSCQYQRRFFWIRYFEKLSKGYVDVSGICLDSADTDPENRFSGTSAPEVLYSRLLAYAKNVVKETLCNIAVTEKQIERGWEIYDNLKNMKTVSGFNRVLSSLLSLSPRRVKNVIELLAKSKDDFGNILDREASLLQSMEAVYLSSHREDPKAKTVAENPFGDISVSEAAGEEREEAMAMIPDEIKGKVTSIYRIESVTQRERFDAYVKERKIKNKQLLWHGSRNENWLSIIIKGLLIRSGAQTTGKSFGWGIYFGNNAMKSWNYCTATHRYWGRDNKNRGRAYLGIYETAYGRPHKGFLSWGDYTQEGMNRLNCDCVHAYAHDDYKYDEIIFYDERAMVIKYLVEFAA